MIEAYAQFGIDPRIVALADEAACALRPRFEEADAVAEFNQARCFAPCKKTA